MSLLPYFFSIIRRYWKRVVFSLLVLWGIFWNFELFKPPALSRQPRSTSALIPTFPISVIPPTPSLISVSEDEVVLPNIKTVLELLDDLNNQPGPQSNWFTTEDGEKLKLMSKGKVLTELSRAFQNQLSGVIKGPPTCANVSLGFSCGVSSSCGFGCNFSHRLACLFLSFAFNIPLIHDEKSYWPYKEKWGKYLRHVGTDCPASSYGRVIPFNWQYFMNKELLAESPLKLGIYMPTRFLEILRENHNNPFLWILGQFAQTLFQPKIKTSGMIERFKESIGISDKNFKDDGFLIGMHVRRTDKYTETDVVLNTTHFMTEAMKLRDQLALDPSTQITVYLASEDCNVVPEFRSLYESQEWKFVSGCKGTESYPGVWERKSQLFEIIRDITVLSQCDHVICTHTSNICRVVLTIRSFLSPDPNPESSVTSLDGIFTLFLWHGGVVTETFRHI